jgi:hypothetical protein
MAWTSFSQMASSITLGDSPDIFSGKHDYRIELFHEQGVPYLRVQA